MCLGRTGNTRGSVFKQMYSTTTCDSPSFHARTTDFIGLFWPKQRIITKTPMPLSFADRITHLGASRRPHPSSNPGSLSNSSSTIAGSAITTVEDTSYESPIGNKDRGGAHSEQDAGPTDTPSPLAPYPGSAPKLPGPSAARSGGTTYVASALIKTALPLLMQSEALQTSSASGTVPNPLASTLARDSLLVYAHQIFRSSSIPGALVHPSRRTLDVTSPEHAYNTQLLPLLNRLRILHPRHLPTLLLLGCVYYAVGNFKESLSINEEILQIDEYYVSWFTSTVLTCLLTIAGRGNVELRIHPKGDGSITGRNPLVVESCPSKTQLLGCGGKSGFSVTLLKVVY